MMLFFINFSKTWKNIYKTNYFTIKVSVIKIDNDFNRRYFDRVSEPLKFRRYLYFRQTVRWAKCPFCKTSVRQNVRSAKCLSAKCLSAKCLSAKCPATHFQTLTWDCPPLHGISELFPMFNSSVFACQKQTLTVLLILTLFHTCFIAAEGSTLFLTWSIAFTCAQSLCPSYVLSRSRFCVCLSDVCRNSGEIIKASGAGCIKKWLKLTMIKCKRHPIRSAYLRVNHYLTTK
jgi:hypothetical protein